MLQSKVVMNKKMEEEYFPGCALFVKEGVKLITFLDHKRSLVSKTLLFTKNQFYQDLQAFAVKLKSLTVVQLSCVLLDEYHKRLP